MGDIARVLTASAWMIFLAVAAFYGIISLVLRYHWNKYGVRLESLKRVRRVYFGVSGFILAGMFALLIFLLI